MTHRSDISLDNIIFSSHTWLCEQLYSTDIQLYVLTSDMAACYAYAVFMVSVLALHFQFKRASYFKIPLIFVWARVSVQFCTVTSCAANCCMDIGC